LAKPSARPTQQPAGRNPRPPRRSGTSPRRIPIASHHAPAAIARCPGRDVTVRVIAGTPRSRRKTSLSVAISNRGAGGEKLAGSRRQGLIRSRQRKCSTSCTATLRSKRRWPFSWCSTMSRCTQCEQRRRFMQTFLPRPASLPAHGAMLGIHVGATGHGSPLLSL